MASRTWLITGVSSGFGRALSEQLLDRGDRVAGTVLHLEAVTDLTEKYPDTFRAEVLDVSETAAIRGVIDRVFAGLGRVDVVISNAGYGLFGASEECTDEQVRHILNTNLIGSIQVIRSALPHLRAQGGGRILQMSSYAGQTAFPGGSMYHVTKWGLEGFAESLAQEVACFGIGVTIVEPGGANTEFRSGGLVTAPEIEAYEGTPAHMYKTLLARSAPPAPGDPAKMAAAMINSVDVEPAPLRLLLGSDAYGRTHQALASRIAALEAQQELAHTTDVDQAGD